MLIILAGCIQQPVQPRKAISAESYPAIGPLPASKAPDVALVAMGKRLFFDPRLSGNGSISCASCHDPRQGFTRQTDKDGKAMTLSDAYPGTLHFRNAPTLLNTFYKAEFNEAGWAWDGRMGANLDDVIRDQISDSVTMNMDMRLLQERMKQDPVYMKMCADTFGGECRSGQARKALVALLTHLTSRDTPFDSGALSPQARQGRALFEGKAECIRCHNGPYFSDGRPHNTGVPGNLEIFRNPLRHIAFRAVMTNHGLPKADIWRRDVGYFLVSKQYMDVGKFITPTLRELDYTAPYMHNGVFDTLEEVLLFYNRGGGHDDPQANELPALGLTEAEQKALIVFLNSLSSRSPVTLEQIETPEGYEPIANWLDVNN